MTDFNSTWYREKILPLLPRFFEHSRWYSGKGRDISAVELLDYGTIGYSSGVMVAVVRIQFSKGKSELYFIPQQTGTDQAEGIADGVASRAYVAESLKAMFNGATIGLENGTLHGISEKPDEFQEDVQNSIQVISGEQSNTSMIIGEKWILKSFRKLNDGENPEYAVTSYLQRKCRFQWVPETLGKLILDTGGTSYDVGILTRYVRNSGDGWKVVSEAVKEIMKESNSGASEYVNNLVEMLKGRLEKLAFITAEMHNCFSRNSTDLKFRPEPVNEQDIMVWTNEYYALLEEVIDTVQSFTAKVPENVLDLAEEFLKTIDYVRAYADSLKDVTGLDLYKTRIHGDYHLGQTLVSGDDFYVIDFEGEPMRPISYRTGKFLPLKDTGGMVRSIAYAVDTASAKIDGTGFNRAFAESLKKGLVDTFTTAYYKSYAPEKPYMPEDPISRRNILDFFVTEKALYEVLYEIRNRPEYSWVPLTYIRELLNRKK